MTAYLVLASVGVLVGLLIHGRIAPAVLFTGLAGAYYLAGLLEQSVWLVSYTNPALAALVLLLLISIVLERASLLDRLSDLLFGGKSRTGAMLRLTGVTAAASAFLNNTAVVGTLLGVVARQRRIPASRLLLPLSYASVLGGVVTLVGTSTNLVVNSFVVAAGMPALGMFTFAWVGLPVALLCLLTLAISARTLPDHSFDEGDQRQAYLLEARVVGGSPLIGKSIEDNRLRHLDGLYLLEIVRDDQLVSPVMPSEILLEDDVLVFAGDMSKVQALQRFQGLQMLGGRADDLLASNLVEVVVSSHSELINRTLREVDFRTMFDAGVVGIRRGEKRLEGQLGRIPLRAGDCLLLAVGPDFAQHRNIDRNFHVLKGAPLRPRLSASESYIALGGFAAVIALAALEWVPLFAGLLVLLAVLLVRKILTPAEMRRRFPFDLLMIIGSALAVASVLESSGAAAIVAGAVRFVFDGYGVFGALVGVYLLTLILTELVTNNAAAALAFPIALSTAKAFGVDPMPFIMVVAYGASACFLMPFGYQTHLMVYSPGRYRVRDFLRAGLPVTVVYSVGVLLLVPLFFPF